MLLALPLLPVLLPLLVVLSLMARHRAPDPQPGDRGWQHPHVAGETDPEEIARILREAEEAERQAQERIRAEQAERMRQQQDEQQRRRS